MHLPPSREEYRPWTGVKPAKSVRKPPPAQYSSPGTHVPPETSYQAAYSGEVSRSTGLHQVEHIPPSTASNAQPPPATQHPHTAQQVSGSPSGLQQGVLPERTEDGGTSRREVRTQTLHCVCSFNLLLLGRLREVIQHRLLQQPKVTRLFWSGPCVLLGNTAGASLIIALTWKLKQSWWGRHLDICAPSHWENDDFWGKYSQNEFYPYLFSCRTLII